VIAEPLRIVRGRIRVPDRPGLGIEIDLEKLERYRVDC
jgi:L-alanine-DL-glutamate epimerase-like enolase superfamily enzyme